MNNKPQAEMTAKPSKYPQGFFKDKPCGRCSAIFKPNAPSHMYCSQVCTDDALTSRYLMRNYNITIDDYRSMLDSQDNKCKLCKCVGFKLKKCHKVLLVVDHCHTTGKVRGLLCPNCNRALGLLKDSLETVRRIPEYLK